MARERRSHAQKKGKQPAAASPADMATDTTLPARSPKHDHNSQLRDLIRALARDAALADHEREHNALPDSTKPPR